MQGNIDAAPVNQTCLNCRGAEEEGEVSLVRIAEAKPNLH